MLEISLTITLLIGLIGMGVILIRKISVLAEFSPKEAGKIGTLGKIKRKIKNNGAVKSFSKEALLQKTLSKVRTISLKTESKTSDWLAKSRRRSLKMKDKFSDDFWRKVKRKK